VAVSDPRAGSPYALPGLAGWRANLAARGVLCRQRTGAGRRFSRHAARWRRRTDVAVLASGVDVIYPRARAVANEIIERVRS